MRFESPWLLLVALPAALAVFWVLRRLARKPVALRFPTLARVAACRPPPLSRLAWVPAAMAAAAVALALVALARPQMAATGEIAGEGADFVIALDMSGSMNAVDMPPERIMDYHREGREPPNRFESARETIKQFILSRDADRVGLVVFASNAYVKFPLTLDKDAMTRILDGLVLDDGVRLPGSDSGCVNGCTINGDSTAIGDALGRAWKRLEESTSKSRTIVLITDGDNNAGKAAPEEVARFIGEQSADRPVHVYTFLVGTGQDTFMPARNPFNGAPVSTATGQRVYERPKEKFPVNPGLLKEVARLTGGKYLEATSEADFRKEFMDLEKTEFRTPALERWDEAFLPPVVAALALLALGQVLGLAVLRRWP